MSMTGGCLCGAVRYSLQVPPVLMAACHCHHCQKQSGSAFSVNLAIPKGTMQLSGSPTKVYQDHGDSGQPVYRHFCGDCGSPIFSEVTVTPQLDWVKAGTLDDVSVVNPTASIWCSSAQPWVAYPTSMARFDANPPVA